MKKKCMRQKRNRHIIEVLVYLFLFTISIRHAFVLQITSIRFEFYT